MEFHFPVFFLYILDLRDERLGSRSSSRESEPPKPTPTRIPSLCSIDGALGNSNKRRFVSLWILGEEKRALNVSAIFTSANFFFPFSTGSSFFLFFSHCESPPLRVHVCTEPVHWTFCLPPHRTVTVRTDVCFACSRVISELESTPIFSFLLSSKTASYLTPHGRR